MITIPTSLSISHVTYYSTVEIGAFKMCIFIGLARVDNAVKLSPHMFISWMYVLHTSDIYYIQSTDRRIKFKQLGGTENINGVQKTDFL